MNVDVGCGSEDWRVEWKSILYSRFPRFRVIVVFRSRRSGECFPEV